MPATDVPQHCLAGPSAGSLVGSIPDDALVYLSLNVGDADCQLVLLPLDDDGRRPPLVVDAVKSDKLIALIEAFHATGTLGVAPQPYLALVVATHPHADHIRGIPSLLDRFAASEPEVWEPGYRHHSGMYLDILERVGRYRLTRTIVSAGLVRHIERTRIKVLAPGVSLQGRFDSYGVNVNDSSVCLKIEYPATQVVRTVEGGAAGGEVEYTFVDYDIGHTILLGADAQMQSWSQVLSDFPQLAGERTPVTEALKIAGGTAPLQSDVFKVPHHGSKHGLTLELVEHVKPKVSIVSSVHSQGQYQFPHEVAMAQLREAVNARSSKPGVPHDPDEDLKLLYTGSQMEGTNEPVGSVCVVCPVGGRRRLWRLMDGPDQDIDLDSARRVA